MERFLEQFDPNFNILRGLCEIPAIHPAEKELFEWIRQHAEHQGLVHNSIIGPDGNLVLVQWNSTEQAILVTQEFHLPRALYTCSQLGLETVGVVADRRPYVRATWYQLRELFALTRAWLDLKLFKPVPVLGDPIPVDWNTRG